MGQLAGYPGQKLASTTFPVHDAIAARRAKADTFRRTGAEPRRYRQRRPLLSGSVVFAQGVGKKPRTRSCECNRSPPLTPVLHKLKVHAPGPGGSARTGYVPIKGTLASEWRLPRNAISAATTPIDGIGVRRAIRPQKLRLPLGRLSRFDQGNGNGRFRARLARCRVSRRRSLDGTESSQSTAIVATALHAPLGPCLAPVAGF